MTSNNAQVSCWDASLMMRWLSYFSLRTCVATPVTPEKTLLLFPPGILMVQAEELMKKIEKEEEQISNDDPNKKVFHHCIVNLVIG